MVKKTCKTIYNAMMAIGTFNQIDFSDKKTIVEMPYLSHSEAKKIIEETQKNVSETMEFKKIKEDFFSKHNGNYIVKVFDDKNSRLCFEIICSDKPFDNRNKKVDKKVKVVHMPKVPETISFDLFSKAVEMPEKVKNNFGKAVGKDKKYSLETWQHEYSDWLEKSKPVEKAVSFNTFVKQTNKDKNWVERFKSENSIDGLHTIKEWDGIFINWIPKNITFSEFVRAKNLPKETVSLYNKDDNTDGLILPIEKWEKKYSRWLEFRKTTAEQKTKETVFDGKVVYKNVEYLLTKQGKNFQDLKNCLPVNLVSKIIKAKNMQDITPKDAARLISFLNTDVNFFLNRNSKVDYSEKEPTIEDEIKKEMKKVEKPTSVEEEKTETVVTEKPVETVKAKKEEVAVVETPKVETKLLDANETKEVLKQEKGILIDRNSELLRNLVGCFDVNAHLTLPEDFNFKQLAALMRDEQKENDKIQSRDFILSSVFVNVDDCAMGEMSMDFVQNLKTIVDEMYENQKTIGEYNV